MSELRQAAQAVVDRWDTPLWKDAPHTAEFIDRLRAALAESPMSERERFEAWARTQPRHEGASMRFLALNNAYIDFDLHGAWLAWQAARSGQAASGSQENARSDVQNGVGQPEAPTAAPLESAAHPAYWPEFPPFPTWIDANDLATLHEWAQTVRRDAFAAGLQRAAIAAHPPARSGAAPKRDHCPEKLKSGGCQLHNLHCGYPKCNEAPVARSGAGSEEGQG